MNFKSVEYTTTFQQIVGHCKEIYGQKLIHHSDQEDHEGNKTLLLQFNFFNHDENIRFPTFSSNDTGVYESNHTVLNLEINSDNSAKFYYKGNINNEGFFELGRETEWISDGDEIFTVHISEPEEIIDLINFINSFTSNKKIELKPNYTFNLFETKNVIERIFIYIPKFSDYMIDYEKIRDKISISQLKDAFYYYPGDDDVDESIDKEASLNETEIFFNNEEFIKIFENKEEKNHEKIENFKNIFLKILGEETNQPKSKDIFYNGSYLPVFGHFSVLRKSLNSAVFENINNQIDIQHDRNNDENIYFILRLNKNTPFISLYDFLNNSTEGNQFLNELKNENKIPEKILFIKDPISCVQYSIESKCNKLLLENKMNSLLKNKESYEFQNSLTKVRTKYLADFYERDHKLIEIYNTPLPYIIESAYRKYIKSSNSLESVKNGQSLLNALIKIRLFIPLEEYVFEGHGQELLTDLHAKPPTDGDLQTIYDKLCKVIGQTNFKLICFGELHNKLSKNEVTKLLNELVVLRNRFAHPPYDELSFLNMLDDYLPILIPHFRDAFDRIDFIVPIEFQRKNQEWIMTGKRLMGFEMEFDTISKKLESENAIRFESNKLCVFNEKNNSIIIFSELLKVTSLNTTLDKIGLFDRMINGTPHYVF